MASGKTVMIRQPLLHGNGTQLLRCEILGTNRDGTLRCRCDTDGPTAPVRTVDAKAVVLGEQLFGSHRRNDRTIVQKQFSQSPWSLGNLIQKTNLS